MPKIPPQSEPVDYKELCKRLEVVARQQEARKRKTRDPKQDEASRLPKQRDSPDRTTEAPPPPSVFSTRPVSLLPIANQPPPQRLQLSRLSLYGTQTSNRVNIRPSSGDSDVLGASLTTSLQDVGQAARQRARTNRRPSTSWIAERQSRQISKEEEEDTGLSLYGPEQRPKSMCNLDVANEPPIIVTEAPAIIKRDSVRRQVQDVAQPVQIVTQNEQTPMTAPVSLVKDNIHAIPLDAPPESIAYERPDISASGFSSATTVVPAHSASSSKSERKSWNPKRLIARFKDRRATSDSAVVTALEHHNQVVKPVHEITLEPMSSVPPNISISNRSTATLDRPTHFHHASAGEPFRFHDHPLSGQSAKNLARASDPYAYFQFSDVDSGLGLSDSGSNAENDELPALIPSPEKQPDWTKVESPIKNKRHSFVPPQGCAATGTCSPLKRPYRLSSLSKEVPIQESFDFNPDPSLRLQEAPPNDEGVIVTLALHDEPAIFARPPPPPPPPCLPLPQLHQSRSVPDFSNRGHTARQTRRKLVKRRTFDPRHLFDTQLIEDDAFSPDRPQSRNTIAYTAPGSPRSTRPSSRSQPIMISPYHIEPLPRSSVRSPISKRPLVHMSAPGSKTVSKQSSITGLQATSNMLIVPNPPEVPAEEMAHMTPQSVALLREQEKRLIRRSTLQLAQAHVQVMQRAFDEKGEIGVAISPVTPFHPSEEERQAKAPPAGLAYNIQYPTAHRLISSPPGTSSHPSRRATATSTPKAVSLRSPKPASRKMFGKDAPATVSMIDLNKLSAKATSNGLSDDPKQPKKKRRWWKVWRLL